MGKDLIGTANHVCKDGTVNSIDVCTLTFDSDIDLSPVIILQDEYGSSTMLHPGPQWDQLKAFVEIAIANLEE